MRHVRLLIIAGASLLFLQCHTLAAECQLTKKAELPIGYSNGLATLTVKVNGQPVVMGIDTGAQTLVTPAAASRLNLPRDWRRTLARGTTASIIANNALIRDLEFAGDHFSWKSVPKIALLEDKGLSPASTGGLIGMDVLADYELDFDFPHRKLTAYTAKHCREIAIPGFTNPKAIPFRYSDQRNILVPVELDGVKLTALFDTGATLHMISRPAARKAGATEAALKSDPAFQATGVGNVSRSHALHRFKRLSAAGFEFSNVTAGVLNRPLPQGDFLLGQPLWLRRRMWISSATRTIYFDDAAFPFPSVTPSPPAIGQSCPHYPGLPLAFCRSAQ